VGPISLPWKFSRREQKNFSSHLRYAGTQQIVEIPHDLAAGPGIRGRRSQRIINLNN
jgi:hypothetical protein